MLNRAYKEPADGRERSAASRIRARRQRDPASPRSWAGARCRAASPVCGARLRPAGLRGRRGRRSPGSARSSIRRTARRSSCSACSPSPLAAHASRFMAIPRSRLPWWAISPSHSSSGQPGPSSSARFGRRHRYRRRRRLVQARVQRRRKLLVNAAFASLRLVADGRRTSASNAWLIPIAAAAVLVYYLVEHQPRNGRRQPLHPHPPHAGMAREVRVARSALCRVRAAGRRSRRRISTPSASPACSPSSRRRS